MSGISGRRKRLARSLLLSLQLLAAHPLRTALSVSGLLVGVAAIIVMVAVGEGAERRVLERLQAMGTNLVIVSAAPAPRMLGRPRQARIYTTLRVADAAAIAAESVLAVAAAPAVTTSIVARSDGLNTATTLTGTTTDGLRIRNIRATSGRLFDDDDNREQRRVALLGPLVARHLFGGADPIGRAIRIGSVPFEVIGVTRPQGTDPGGVDHDDRIVIPLMTAMRRVLNISYVHTLLVQSRTSADLDRLERDVRDILHRRLDVRSGTAEPFVIQNQAVLLRTERGAARALNRLVMGAIVLSLAVGSVGIVAVMLISVRERTSEIGLRRALGAKRRDIRLQFILESAILAAGGGAAGAAAGGVAALVGAVFGPWELVVSWRVALLGFAGSALLGLAVGTIPAARAARLEPVAALRAG